MFNPDEYWRKKQERKERAITPFSEKAVAFLTGFFHRQEEEKEPTRKGHTRSAKERRKRRMKHKSMMRNVA